MKIEQFDFKTKISFSEAEKDMLDECYLYEDSLIALKRISNEKDLECTWENSAHFVAGNIQARLEELGLDEQYAWNIYLVFEISSEISIELKNYIESNKFCCKKYVVQTLQTTPFEEMLSSIIPLFGNIEDQETINGESTHVENNILEQIFSNMYTPTSAMRNIIKSNRNLAQIVTAEQFKTYVSTLLSSQDEVKNSEN